MKLRPILWEPFVLANDRISNSDRFTIDQDTDQAVWRAAFLVSLPSEEFRFQKNAAAVCGRRVSKLYLQPFCDVRMPHLLQPDIPQLSDIGCMSLVRRAKRDAQKLLTE